MLKQTNLFTSTSQEFVLFDEQNIRKERYQDERYFSVVDIVGILSWSVDGRKYRNKLKQRLKAEWNEMVTNCHQLKFIAADGKKYSSDAANTATALRIIQSIPSPNAEPLKQRLASLGNERILDLNDPELGIQRARAVQVYKKRGMTDEEIRQRIQSIETRNTFTDQLKERGIKDWFEYAYLTNKTYSIFGADTTATTIKEVKGLAKSDNIRDHMNKQELLLTEMTEETAKDIMVGNDAKGFNQLEECVEMSVEIMTETREKIEKATKHRTLSGFNRLSDQQKEKRNLMTKRKSLK